MFLFLLLPFFLLYWQFLQLLYVVVVVTPCLGACFSCYFFVAFAAWLGCHGFSFFFGRGCRCCSLFPFRYLYTLFSIMNELLALFHFNCVNELFKFLLWFSPYLILLITRTHFLRFSTLVNFSKIIPHTHTHIELHLFRELSLPFRYSLIFWGPSSPPLSLIPPSHAFFGKVACPKIQTCRHTKNHLAGCLAPTQTHTQTEQAHVRTKTRFVVSFKLILAFFMCTAFSTSRRVSPSSTSSSLHFSSPRLFSSLFLVSILRPRPAFLALVVLVVVMQLMFL